MPSGTQSTAVFRVRPGGSNLNGGGYDAGISGAGTDYSQQDTAQLSLTDLAAAGSTAVITSATGGFSNLMVGNAMWINSGTNFKAGIYWIVTYTSSGQVTLDRNPGTVLATACSSGAIKVGGGWRDFWTNAASSVSGAPVAGNIVYIKGSTTPNPSSYTYDYTNSGGFVGNGGDTNNGPILYASDPTNGAGVYPVIKLTTNSTMFYATDGIKISKLWWVAATDLQNIIRMGSAPSGVDQCFFDSFGWDVTWLSVSRAIVTRNEFTTTQATRGFANNPVVDTIGGSCQILHNNFHGTSGTCIAIENGYGSYTIQFNLFSKCRKDCITTSFTGDGNQNIQFNTFDAPVGHGIDVQGSFTWACTHISNNLFANVNGSGKKAINATGAPAVNDKLKGVLDFNTFYNSNNYNTSSITGGANDTTGGVDPFANQSTGDYTLTSTYKGVGCFPGGALPQVLTGNYG